MKLAQVLDVIEPVELRGYVEKVLPGPLRVSSKRHLSRELLVLLEETLFVVQNQLESEPRKGRRPVNWIATLNDIRNVILDSLEVNEARPGMRWPGVERMRCRIQC